MQLSAREFNAADFVQQHQSDYVIFMLGGMNRDGTSYYSGLLCFGKHRPMIRDSKCRENSPNRAILAGVMDACERLNFSGRKLYLITATPLGFKSAAKGNGTNAGKVKEVLRICEEKRIELHDIDVHGGSDVVRAAIEGKQTG